jgi:hypothetical protein
LSVRSTICGDEYTRAVQVFGVPDFIHIGWDRGAKQEVVPGDVAVFARGTIENEPSERSFSDVREG